MKCITFKSKEDENSKFTVTPYTYVDHFCKFDSDSVLNRVLISMGMRGCSMELNFVYLLVRLVKDYNGNFSRRETPAGIFIM